MVKIAKICCAGYKYLIVDQYQQGLVTLELHDYAACMGVVYKKFVLYMNF